MSNLFDSTNYAETEPTKIVRGDRLAWKRTDLNADYSNALYELSYTGRLEGTGTTKIAITAAASSSDYLVEVSFGITGTYTIGNYQWDAYITRLSDSERIRIDSGLWEVQENKATKTSDPRSHAKIVLDAIEATLEKRATKDQMSYTIAGRSLSRMDINDLMLFRDRYRAEVKKELRKERMKNGKGSGSLIKVRF